MEYHEGVYKKRANTCPWGDGWPEIICNPAPLGAVWLLPGPLGGRLL